MDGGRLFQTFAAATGKARSPIDLCFDHGTCSSAVDTDRSRLREPMSATRCNPSARYCGAETLADTMGSGLRNGDEHRFQRSQIYDVLLRAVHDSVTICDRGRGGVKQCRFWCYILYEQPLGQQRSGPSRPRLEAKAK